METERSYQDKLAANRYAILNDGNDDDWSIQAPQYEEREENPRRMRENGKATKQHEPNGEKTNRHLPYGILKKVVTNRHASHRVETATRRHATHRLETNRFPKNRFATYRNGNKHSNLPANHSGGSVATDEYPTGDKNTQVISPQSVEYIGVIPTTKDENIQSIPPENNKPTQNTKK